jgi:hypothetical protein
MTPTIPDALPVTQTPPPINPAATVDPLVARYAAELPALLETDAGRWVVYTDDGLRKIAKTKTELYLYCLNEMKLRDEQFILRRIEPDPGPDVESTYLYR